MTRSSEYIGWPVDKLLEVVDGGVSIYDLAQPLENGMPGSPNHPQFRMSLLRRHGDMHRPDGSSAANELIVTGGHVGTHIDALSHVSYDGKLYGGYETESAQRGGRFSVHGVETIRPMVCRGTLLDIAAARRTLVLPAGYGITAEDLDQAAHESGVEPRHGDVCVIRTGWARHWNQPEIYLGQETGAPGLTAEAASWLAHRGVRAVGADTAAVEQIPAGQGHSLLPVHRMLLVDHGIYIIENLLLEDLAVDAINEFTFILSPLKIMGGTGSPIRPLALTSSLASSMATTSN